jgi:hypothetical protein
VSTLQPVPVDPPTLPPGAERAIERLEEAIGGRQALVRALATAPLTPDLRYVLHLIADPANDARNLGTICAMGQILPGELLQHYKSAVVAQAQVLAMHEVAARLPDVAADTMLRAAPYEDVCDRCDGDGTLPTRKTDESGEPIDKPCPRCKGVGRRLYRPELDQQKVALELGGLLSKGSGVHVAVGVQQTVTASGGTTAFAALQTVVDEVLRGQPRLMSLAPAATPPTDLPTPPIDVSAVPEAPDPPDATP